MRRSPSPALESRLGQWITSRLSTTRQDDSILSQSTTPLSYRSLSPHRKSMTQKLLTETPLTSSTLEDYLIRFRALKKTILAEWSYEQNQESRRLSSTPHMSPYSRHLLRSSWQRTIRDMFKMLDKENKHFIDLTNVNELLESCELDSVRKEFIGPPLMERSKVKDAVDYKEFEAMIHDIIRKYHGFRANCLLRKGGFINPQMPLSMREREIEERLRPKIPFSPRISKQSVSLASKRRKSEGNASKEKRLSHLVNEKKRWEKRREEMRKDLEEKELEKCTFQPQIKQSRYASPRRKRLHRDEYVSKNEKDITECTFQPNRVSKNSYHLYKAGQKKSEREKIIRESERQNVPKMRHVTFRTQSPRRARGWHPDDLEW